MVALDFYEVVTVLDTLAARELNVANKLGVVLGKAEENGVNYYAISIDGYTYSLSDDDLRSTGRRLKREDIYSGEVLRVSPDGEVLRWDS